jgi:hypothetical protein
VLGKIMGSVVLRNMKRSPHFHRGDDGPSARVVPLDSDEAVVGTYENPSPWERNQVVFTDDGLYLIGDAQTVKVRWSDIVDYETLDPAGNVDGVRLRTRDGIRFVRIAGAYGPDAKFRDAFNFAMVLRSLLGK